MHRDGGVDLGKAVSKGGVRPRPRLQDPAQRPLPAAVGSSQVVVQVIPQGLPLETRRGTRTRRRGGGGSARQRRVGRWVGVGEEKLSGGSRVLFFVSAVWRSGMYESPFHLDLVPTVRRVDRKSVV